MAILVRSKEGNWMKTEPKPFAKEVELQYLLLNSPELIEMIDGSKLVFTKEAGLDSANYADLIGVTTDGDILIVETKLAKNPEIRRKVIGQILEYAACLWKTEYSSFDGYFAKTGKSIVEALGIDQGEAESFRSVVTENLTAGKFHLLIAVDEMTPELDKILSYISSRGDGVQLEALAVRIYEQGEVQVLVPQRYGLQEALTPSPMTPKRLSVDELIANSPSDDMREKMKLVADMWRDGEHHVLAAKIALSCRVGLPGKLITMFWATPNDTYGLQPNFLSMEQQHMPAEVLTTLRQGLSRLPGVSPEKMLTGQTPTIKLSQVDIETVRTFMELVLDAAAKWKENYGPLLTD